MKRLFLIVGILLALTVPGATQTLHAFGDSADVDMEAYANLQTCMSRFRAPAYAGVLCRIVGWIGYVTGVDTVRACIYDSAGNFLARSLDSIIVSDNSMGRKEFHFDSVTTTTAIGSSKRYWVGFNATGTGDVFYALSTEQSGNDSTTYFSWNTDPLPFNSTLDEHSYYPAGIAARSTFRIAAYYRETATNAQYPLAVKRRRIAGNN